MRLICASLTLALSLIGIRAYAADCGTTGTIEERIADCKQSSGVWKIVSRIGAGGNPAIVWKDTDTGILWGAGEGRSLDRKRARDLCASDATDPARGNIQGVHWEVPRVEDYDKAFDHDAFFTIADLRGTGGDVRQYWLEGRCNHPILDGITYYSGSASLVCSDSTNQSFQVKCISRP